MTRPVLKAALPFAPRGLVAAAPLGVLAFVAACAGCAHGPQASGSSAGAVEALDGGGASALPDPQRPYRGPELDVIDRVTLGPGDAFQVRVYLQDDLSGDFRVGPDGKIVFPLVGELDVDGQTPSQVAGALRERLADGYLKQPEVTVFVKEFKSKKVFVFGQVKQPGTYPYENGMSIIHAVTLAGGFTPTAARNQTNVTRMVGGAESRVTVPVDAIVEGRTRNYTLRPGDIIYIPESFF